MSRLAFGAALSDNFMQNRQYYQKTIREFGIKHNRYVNYRVALVDEMAIRLPVQSSLKGMVSYPELTH